MSRSYKKTPIIKDNGSGKKFAKKIANKRIRTKLKQDIEIGDGNEFKKHSESWDIADYVSRYTEHEAIEDYNTNNYLHKKYPTLESWIKEYRKYYKRK